jgi:NAD(P)-dependent dehydrogenase (short-subunit alcohol dehydrogenase family)
MEGRPVSIVTGASTGLGFHTALALLKRGHTVIVASHRELSGTEATAQLNRLMALRRPSFLDGDAPNGEACFMRLDVSSLASVAAFAAAFLERFRGQLHTLVLNAGISGFGIAPEARRTPEGYERIFATNFLGHFHLTQLLLGALEATAAAGSAAPASSVPVRIVCLGSVTHRLVKEAPSWPAVLTGSAAKKGPGQYALSKLAAILFAFELQRRFQDSGSSVSAVAVNPGAVLSDIWRSLPQKHVWWFRPLSRLTFLTPEQGSATSVAACTAGELQGMPLAAPARVYLSPYACPGWVQRTGGLLALLFDALGPFAGARPVAPTQLCLDRQLGSALWEACEAAVARTQG